MLVNVGEVCWCNLFFLLSIFTLSVVCLAGVVEVGVVGVAGFMVWSMCWLCCVLCRFVWICSRLCCVSFVPPAMYLLL